MPSSLNSLFADMSIFMADKREVSCSLVMDISLLYLMTLSVAGATLFQLRTVPHRDRLVHYAVAKLLKKR